MIFLAASLTAAAEENAIKLQGTVDKNKITIGDRIQYRLTFFHPETITVIPPEKTAEIGPWEVKDMAVSNEKKETLNTIITYTLAAYTTGEVLIPEITIKYQDDKKTVKEIKTNPLPITIESFIARLKEKQPGLRDIAPPIRVRLPWLIYFLWTLFGLIIIGGLFALYRLYKKPSDEDALKPAVPLIPPHKTALQELEKLQQSTMIADGLIKEYYIALADIIRKYIGAIYGFETMDRTTSEMYALLRQKESDKRRLGLIKDFFDACDLVKFAKYRPDGSVCTEDWETAKSLIIIPNEHI
jgi:hypothetical protein